MKEAGLFWGTCSCPQGLGPREAQYAHGTPGYGFSCDAMRVCQKGLLGMEEGGSTWDTILVA